VDDGFRDEVLIRFCCSARSIKSIIRRKTAGAGHPPLGPFFRMPKTDGVGFTSIFRPDRRPGRLEGLTACSLRMISIDGQGRVTQVPLGLYWQKEKTKTRYRGAFLLRLAGDPRGTEFNILKGLFGYRGGGQEDIQKFFIFPRKGGKETDAQHQKDLTTNYGPWRGGDRQCRENVTVEDDSNR